MTIQEFYKTPEVQKSLEVQKRNPYGSAAHKEAYYSIMDAANKYGVQAEYVKSGGGVY